MARHGADFRTTLPRIQGWLRGQSYRISHIGRLHNWFNALCCHYLKFLVIYKQGVLHFHFAVGLTYYVASPTHMEISKFLL